MTHQDLIEIELKRRNALVDSLFRQGAEIVIAGCSELSIGFYETDDITIPWIDPLEIIANITLDLAFGYRSLPRKNGY